MIFKIFSSEGILIGSVKYPMDAAILVAYQTEGATVRFGNRKWQTIYKLLNSNEAQDSFDTVLIAMDDGMVKLTEEYKRRLQRRKTQRLPALEKSLEEWSPK